MTQNSPIHREQVDDVRITEILELSTPAELTQQLPADENLYAFIYAARKAAHRILSGADDRLMVIMGPCSIHDPRAAMEYAERLAKEAAKHQKDLQIIMRVYFEKPRTTVGWKGLINDPDLNESYHINKGLKLARELLLEVNRLNLPVGNEFLDMITPQYYADLVSWGAIGARTTESQVHRELASGMSCPMGFKNGTDGNFKIAVDAIRTAMHPHCFLSVTKAGRSAIVRTAGNEDTHMILRGGNGLVNYRAADVEAACQALAKAGLQQRLMIDFSHANSEKKFAKQMAVADDVAAQMANGEARIFGVMVESNLEEGRQDLVAGQPLTYGQSITDACIGWNDSVQVLETLAEAVQKRRRRIAGEEL